MVWTGFQATLGAVIAEMILRLISVLFVLKETIRLLLRQDNSISTIRKAMKTANFWGKITSLCFWSAKSNNSRLLRFFICLRIFGVVTWLVPLITAISSYFISQLEPFFDYGLKASFYYDMVVCILIAIYAALLYKKGNRF